MVKNSNLYSSPLEQDGKLSVDEIKSFLRTEHLASEMTMLPIVDSTNRYAKILAQRDAVNGSVVLTEWQYSGYGQKERIWHSSAGSDIALTVILRPEISPEESGTLSLLTAIAVRRALKKCCSLEADIKWPNDLNLDGKKICGILAETAIIGDKLAYAVLGVGLNVNSIDLNEDIIFTATSLRKYADKIFDRNQLIAEILNELEIVLNSAWIDGEKAILMDEYRKHNSALGKRVCVSGGDGKDFVGQIEDFDESGALVLKLDDGALERFMVGEASLKNADAIL